MMHLPSSHLQAPILHASMADVIHVLKYLMGQISPTRTVDLSYNPLPQPPSPTKKQNKKKVKKWGWCYQSQH